MSIYIRADFDFKDEKNGIKHCTGYVVCYDVAQKDYGFITAYKNKLELMLERVKNNGFHMAVQNNTDYKKINSVPILWRDKNNKLDYDAREKDLTLWFSESLEKKINELKKQF